jgi:hypothetical protein
MARCAVPRSSGAASGDVSEWAKGTRCHIRSALRFAASGDIAARCPGHFYAFFTQLAVGLFFRYVTAMICLTKQEQMVLCVVLGLLLTGLAVKTYRTAHPPVTAPQPATP